MLADELSFVQNKSDVTIDSVTASKRLRRHLLATNTSIIAYSAVVYSQTDSDMSSVLASVQSELLSAFNTSSGDDDCGFASALSSSLSSSSVTVDCAASSSLTTSSLTISYNPSPAPTASPGTSSSNKGLLDGNVTVAASALVVVLALVGTVVVVGVVRQRNKKSGKGNDGDNMMSGVFDLTVDENDNGIVLSDEPRKQRGTSFEFLNDPSWRANLDRENSAPSDSEQNRRSQMFNDVLLSAGLGSYKPELAELGVMDVNDLRRLLSNDDHRMLETIGIRKLQVSKLRRALEPRNIPTSPTEGSRLGSEGGRISENDPDFISRAFSFRSVQAGRLVSDQRASASKDRGGSFPRPPSLAVMRSSDALDETQPEFKDLLDEAGLKEYATRLGDIGVQSVDDTVNLLQSSSDEAETKLKSIGFRRVQIARLRQAVTKSRPGSLTPVSSPRAADDDDNEKAGKGALPGIKL